MPRLHVCILIINIIMAGTFRVSARIILVPDECDTIQTAIDMAESGDEVVVRDGTYQGEGFRDIRFLGKAIIVRSENGRDNCIIEGPPGYSDCHAFIFDHYETSQSILMGFTISDFRSTEYGAGIYIRESSPTLLDCEFSNNESFDEGGVICIDYSSGVVSISNCVFTGNISQFSGGAVYAWCASIEFTGNAFINNIGSFDGGAVGLWKTTGVIADCVFDSNVNDAKWALLDAYGGAIGAWRTSITIVNCLIINNIARGIDEYPNAYNGIGGGVLLDNYSQNKPNQMINCTVYGNKAEIHGHIDGVEAIHDIVLRSCVIWNNNPTNYIGPYIFEMQYCVIQGGYPGEGNIDEAPQYNMPENDLFYLLPSSSCIDSGHILSSDICFDTPGREICMDELIATVDGIPDTGMVDRGYHYSEPCPGVSTATPTSTCSETGVELYMPSHLYSPGDSCECSVTVCNITQSILNNYPLFVILDVYGEYFFGPTFSSDFDSYILLYPEFPFGETLVDVIPPFIWPEDAGKASGIYFYAALTDPSVSQIYGKWDSWEFGWSENAHEPTVTPTQTPASFPPTATPTSSGPTPTPPPAPAGFVYIPAGTFQMGSPTGEMCRESDEGPMHSVTLTRGFYMQQTEVTQQQWVDMLGDNPSHFTGINRPVEQVTWYDCCI